MRPEPGTAPPEVRRDLRAARTAELGWNPRADSGVIAPATASAALVRSARYAVREANRSHC